MRNHPRTVLIIGGGIAGLCTAVYAQRSGYQAKVLEMGESPGGLATSWRRGDYTFETCLHWLLGSRPGSDMYSRWREVFDIDRLKFVHHEEFLRLERPGAAPLHVYTNPDRLREELLHHSPIDAHAILDFISSIHTLSTFALPDPTRSWLGNWEVWLKDAPHLALFHQVASTTSAAYGNRFHNESIRSFFGGADSDRLSALAILFTLAWMSNHDAGYPIGGSQAVIRLVAEKLASLGGQLRCNTRVEKILTEGDTAVGVKLADGEILRADWIISAADLHSTVFDLLDGRFRDDSTDKIFSHNQTFTSYVQVSLGIARDLSTQPGFLVRLLDNPLRIDPGTLRDRLSFRIFNYDPTFAPAGRTAVTCFLPTQNDDYWVALRNSDRPRYDSEKQRLADAVIQILDQRLPGIRSAVEVIDVSTPATVIRQTANWKGSSQGWLITPETGYRQLPTTLPRLARFRMVGQWVMPGGGLPSGLVTARSAVHALCEQDHVDFAATRTAA